MNNEKTKAHIKWAKEYIENFNRNEGFNPYDALMGKESRQQKLYRICVDYLEKMQKSEETINGQFETERNQIVFGGTF